ncbi:SDR family NAD(P)-dependent oxidoreductase [Acidobacteria bacterium AH-259-D05]|nr:SDR family NAD(P)-dependent oxidoreductase [Acidobacteria bacterium AH-259-D05]
MQSDTNKILITGASSGIGEATAYAFSNPQCELFLVARRQERLAQIAESCQSKGARRAVYRSHDLSIAGQGITIVKECIEELGGLDVLICNAGYGIYGPVVEIPPEDMAHIWQVNFQSGYESIYAALPHLLQQKKGHIVLISSIIGKKAFPFAGSYCVTKFAQVAVGEALWGELKGTGVGVSVICPGYTASEFQKSAQKTKSLQPMRRLGDGQSPDVVAQAIVGAIGSRKREVYLTLSGKIFCLLSRFTPSLVNHALAWVINREQNKLR